MAQVVNLEIRRAESVDLEALAAEVIEFLNERAGKRFPARLPRTGELSKSARYVVRLLADGYDVADIKSVVAMKCRQWRRSERMRPYLRPKTLFGPENFEQYVGELGP